MLRAILAVLALVGPDAADVRAHVEGLFAEEKYAEAIEICQDEYARGHDPVFLYVEAQAERFRGNCDRAVELYVRVLAEAAEGPMKDNARDNIEVCAEELGRDADPKPPPKVEPDPKPEPPPPRVTPAPTIAADRPPAPTSASPWWRDPAGGALVGIGAVTVAVGGGLLVGGAARRRSADAAEHEAAFIDGHASAERLTIAGAVVTGLGAALMVAGIIRYAVIARPPRRESARRAPLGRGAPIRDLSRWGPLARSGGEIDGARAPLHKD